MWLYSILPNIEVTVALSQLEATYKSNACEGGVVAFTHGQSEASSIQTRRRFTVPHTVFILQASASFERVALVCHRSHGGQRKLFKDTLKAPLKAFSIAPDHWEEAAQDRTYWRYSVHKGAQQYEAIRTAVAQKRSQDRKARAADPHTVPIIPCPHCQRTVRAQIALT